MLYKTQGIIIKKVNLGEFDRLMTVYTKDFGKILLKAKAVRKNQAKLRGHLDLFLCSHIMFAPSKGLNIITGAETIESFFYLHKNLDSLAIAYYLSEIIDKLIIGPEKDENIWTLLLSSFEKLNQGNLDIKMLVKDFENKLIDFLGYGQDPKNNLSFIESFLKEELNSKYFLQEVLSLLK